MDETSSSAGSDEGEGEPALRALMIDYQAGDLGAFERLYALLAAEVRRYLATTQRDRAALDDLVQDTFLEMHRSRRSYAPPLPVRPWIFGIARNVALRQVRAAALAMKQAATQGAACVDLAPAQAAVAAEWIDLQRALAFLPKDTRRTWLLHHVAGFDFRAIAARLGLSVVAAKLRASRATRALRVRLNGPAERDDE